MAENTKIEWADHTASPWHGCSKVHTGCENCYAEALAKRNPATLGIWGETGTRVKSKSFIRNLHKWDREARRAGRIASVFPSLCDPFEDRPELEPWRREMFEAIDQCPNLRLLLLTKRPENVRGMWPGVCHDTDMGGNGVTMTMHRPNVHLLYSASDQPSLDAGIDHLLACRPLVPVLGLSLEPLVGPVDLTPWLLGGERNVQTCSTCDGEGVPKDVIAKHAAVCQYMSHDINDGAERVCSSCGSMLPACAACEETGGKVYLPTIDWVIVGGESGPGARPCNVAWIRSIIRQCKAAGVPVFVKQLGSRPIDTGTHFDWPGGTWFGADPDYGNGARVYLDHPKGGNPAEWPEDLRVQEFPEVAA